MTRRRLNPPFLFFHSFSPLRFPAADREGDLAGHDAFSKPKICLIRTETLLPRGGEDTRGYGEDGKGMERREGDWGGRIEFHFGGLRRLIFVVFLLFWYLIDLLA